MNDFDAFCFDECVMYLGGFIEQQLAEVEDKGKRALLLSKILQGKERFADPLTSGKVPKDARL